MVPSLGGDCKGKAVDGAWCGAYPAGVSSEGAKMKFCCPECGKNYSSDEDLVAVRRRCGNCGTRLVRVAEPEHVGAVGRMAGHGARQAKETEGDATDALLAMGLLLKKATKLKRQGDIEGAIAALREAYDKIASVQPTFDTPTVYPVAVFLRLPAYLRKAGRTQEALDEFKRLLVDGYPHQMRTPEALPIGQAQVYDKMRLFFKREKQPQREAICDLLSFLGYEIGWWRSEYMQERRSSASEVENRVTACLEDIGRVDMLLDIASLVRRAIAQWRSTDIVEIGRQISSRLGLELFSSAPECA